MMAFVQSLSHNHDADAAAWLYANSGDGFALIENGRLVSVNPAWCKMNGFRAEECIGQHALKTIHPDDRQAYFDAAAQLEIDGEANLEHRVCTGDGRIIWVRLAVKQAQDGLFMVVMKDVTAEREKQMEEDEAAKSSELLRAMAGVFVWKFDPDTGSYNVEAAPQPGEHGLGAEKVSTGQMTENIHPEDRAAFGKLFLPSIQTGASGTYEYRYARPDGSWARYRSAWRGARQCAGGKWEIRGLTQDVTELVEARDAALSGERAAKAAAEAKSQFLANMSHEIRTPLNGVLGVLHLLRDETLSAQGRRLIVEAVHCGGILSELVNDILDLSKMEAGRLDLKSEAIDVAAMIEGVGDILRPQIEAKGLRFDATVDVYSGWMQGDPVRLRQILFNLVGNAAKFTHQGGVSIRLTAAGAGEARRLRFEVVDTGIGMSEQTQSGLFTGFHQADGSITRKFGGTGLGLAIARTLTELMGGEIGVNSVEGQGSTFWIDLPVPEIAAPEDAGDKGGWLEGLRILVVEDNPTNRLIATKMLETLGASVETAENGALGVEAMQARDFDLVFMDIQMPVMDGMSATTAIRALPAPACQAPIIAVTANTMAHQAAEYARVGMNGLIAKPLSPSAIIAEIAKLAA
jgi:PAS domain S-box-containing protein